MWVPPPSPLFRFSRIVECDAVFPFEARFFDNDHRVGALRDRRAGHNPRRLPWAKRFGWRAARGDLFDDRQDASVSRQITDPNRVSVHQRLVERRQIEVAGDILRKDEADRITQCRLARG